MTVHWHDDEYQWCPCDEEKLTEEQIRQRHGWEAAQEQLALTKLWVSGDF